MPRGRPRTAAANLPSHIDAARVPRGVYWDASGTGRWYVFEVGEDGRRRRRTVAQRDARLSELHEIAEGLRGVDRRSLAWLLDQFHASKQCSQLAPATRRDYEYTRGVVLAIETRIGRLGALEVDRMTPAFVQRIVDRIAAEGTPTKANKIIRYLRRVCRWGINRGLCKTNPARGLEQAKERKQRRLPTPEVFARLLQFARERGQRPAHTKGSCAPYLWIAMELAYGLRLRGIEVDTLTDAHWTKDGVMTNRRKGSRDNLVRWTPHLEAVWAAATEYRQEAMQRHARPVPLRAEDRVLLVSEQGTPLSKSGLDSAWQRLMRLAIKEGIIAPDQRFSMHDLKRRGITSTPGTRAQKQDASGHREESMLDVYDFSLPVVDPAPHV